MIEQADTHRAGRYGVIDDALAETSYGQTLENMVRWQRFKPDSISNAEWVRLLGKDVHNLHHMVFMRQFSEWFLNTCNMRETDSNGFVKFDDRGIEQILLTATIHDIAEAVHGDIPNPLKTSVHEDAELQTLESILGESFEHLMTPEEVARCLHIMRNKETELGVVWRAIEDMGYIRAGVCAYRRASALQENPNSFPFLSQNQKNDLMNNLSAMAWRVFQYELPKMILSGKPDKYVAIQKLLEMYAPVISHAFNYLDIKRSVVAFSHIQKGNIPPIDDATKLFAESSVTWKNFVTKMRNEKTANFVNTNAA